MIIDVYNSTGNLINSLYNVEKIVACRDGRYLITAINKCKCCNQDARLVTQIPNNYKIEIKPEFGDEVTVSN